MLDKLALRRLPVRSISSEAFLDALRQGRRLYDRATIRAYLREEQAPLDAVRPDDVVGDFRLSLAISARLAGVPYATLTNAYWSPHAGTHDVTPSTRGSTGSGAAGGSSASSSPWSCSTWRARSTRRGTSTGWRRSPRCSTCTPRPITEYRYKQFCELYRAWLRRRSLTMRIEHTVGDKAFVDYSGNRLRVVNQQTGECVRPTPRWPR